MARWRPGTVVTGTITRLTDFGVFVALDGAEGLLLLHEMSWGRAPWPLTAHFTPGHDLRAVVLKEHPTKNRVLLGIRQLRPDPWADVTERYPVGRRIRGRVTSTPDYGLFVELEPEVEGILHVSAMPEGARFTVGDEVFVTIRWVDPDERRMGLSLPGGTE
ncbi:MAG: S1 RNA-binding domain-containing protein [Myxococcota bacterium]